MQIAMIAAMAANRVIGIDNQMPWHLSDDLKYFKATTLGKAVICGRKTYESVGRLPGRPNIVVSRSWQAPALESEDPCQSVYSASSLEQALEIAQELAKQGAVSSDEIMIIGGGEIYQLGLPLSHKIYLTLVDAEVEGDALFPELDSAQWQLENSEYRPVDDKHKYSFHWNTYTKI